MNLLIQLGYVETSNFHVYPMRYTGRLKQNDMKMSKYLSWLIEDLGNTIQDYIEYAIEEFGAEDDADAPGTMRRQDSYTWMLELAKCKFDGNLSVVEFFESRGWQFGTEPKEAIYLVQNVGRFLNEDSDYLEWFNLNGGYGSTLSEST